ncbi:MAG: aldehyde dehydrogenase family protein [Candidatus Jordarchaeum sp.]|uniref:aldehyde dehydrogenase family protein n=1 Tax=Candidatus Jordarchaeum sp. TaxID=2823881 RepID=UPI00404B96A8
MTIANTSKDKIFVKDKYSGELIQELPADNMETLREKIKKVYKLEKKMAETTFDERIDFLRKVSRRIRLKRQKIKETIAREGGLPIKYANWEVGMISQGYLHADWRAEMISEHKIQAMRGESRVCYHPLGTCGSMTPRNTPFSLTGWALGASWLTGNPCILKPSSAVPLSPLLLHDIAQDVAGDFPVEASEVVVMPGDAAATEFVANPMVSIFLFFGSSHVGKQLFIDYADYLKGCQTPLPFASGFMNYGRFKKFIFEMAGNDAGIILGDVDIDKAANFAVKAALTNSGQQCFSMKRILIHETIFDDFVESMINHTEKLKMGNPLDPTVDIGPLGSEKIMLMIDFMVKDALNKGGKLLFGGERQDPFYLPTIIRFEREQVMNNDQDKLPFMWVEEAFGPARSVVPFRDEDEAILLANSTPYGMRASIYSDDLDKANRVARKLETAGVFINTQPGQVDISMKMGGYKDSGFPPGARYIIHHMVREQYIHVEDAFHEKEKGTEEEE